MSHKDDVSLRRGSLSDYSQFKAAHQLLLPVTYPETFFADVLQNQLPLHCICLVSQQRQELIGFATARLVPLQDARHNDRQCLCSLLGLQPADSGWVVYILTIGVLPAWRRQGFAQRMIQSISSVRASAIVGYCS